MKTQFLKQIDLIKLMAISNITERMQSCDILTFDENEKGIYLGNTYKYFTQLKKGKEGISLLDKGEFIAYLDVLQLNELCIISDALNY